MTSQGIISTDTVSTPALLLEEDQEHTVTHLVVHPLVLLHVLDHHTRRKIWFPRSRLCRHRPLPSRLRH